VSFSFKSQIFSAKFLGLIAFAFLFLFYGIHSYPLFSLDEVRYAETAREMIERNDYISPFCNYVLRPEKPIFFYWLEILSFKLFGFSELSARLPSVLMGTFAVGMVFLLAEFFGFGLIASLVMLTSIEFTIVSKLSITDMTLNAFITATTVCLFLSYVFWSGETQKSKANTFLYLAGFWSALGCLTKGPVAVALPGLVFLVFLISRLKLICFLKAFWRELLVALGIFLLVTLPWFVAVHFATDGEFTQRFFFQENINRFLAVQTGHSAPWFYYLPVFMVGFIPWIYFFPQAINSAITNLKSSAKDSGPKNDLLLFSCLWFLVIFLFFSLAQTKLTTYIIGVFAPASLLVGAWFFDLSVRNTKKMGIILGQAFFILSALAVYFVSSFFKSKFLEIDPNAFGPQILLVVNFLVIGGLVSFYLLFKKFQWWFYSLVMVMVLVFCFVNDNFIRPISFFRDSGTREFVANLSPDDTLVSFIMAPERFEFYGKRQVLRFQESNLKKSFNALELSSSTANQYIVIKTKDLDKFFAISGASRQDFVIKTKFFSVLKIH
jgi:4-amino-4-deoxy-L-arabinose transferase-like glycosyltransferase